MSLFAKPLASVADYRLRARRRLPGFAFDFLDGGAEDGVTLRANEQAFARVGFDPRVMRDVSAVDCTVEVLGRRQALPFIVGPTGFNGLYWPEADSHLAAAAHAAGVPFALSTASTSLLEDVRGANDGRLWMQLYVHEQRAVAEDLMRRAGAAGYDTLLLAVDVPVLGNRDAAKRHGLLLPFKLRPHILADAIAHPRWALRAALAGAPQLKNLLHSRAALADPAWQAEGTIHRMDQSLNWKDIAWIRRHWAGALLIKGIQSVADARLAQEQGVDGIVVSNHGGRQLDGAPATLSLLPDIADAVGHRLEVLLDGGVRRGSDVVKALALGARAVLLGRAPLYGLAAAGPRGVADVLQILRDELEVTLKLLGQTRADSLERTHLREPPAAWSQQG